MSRLRKYYRKDDVLLITSRTEEGSPFAPVKYINQIIESSIAKAQEKYPVNIICYCFSVNHFHKLIQVIDPETVPEFIRYIKQETAHAINRLLGRRSKTVWKKGYDSPVILDSEEVLNRIAYVLLNPLKDKLTPSMEAYKGVSSYNLLMNKQEIKKCIGITRDSIPQLQYPHNPKREEQEVSQLLKSSNLHETSIVLSPYSWKSAFANTKDLSDEQVRVLILNRLKRESDKLEKRKSPQECQSLLKQYLPKTHGKRMICLSSRADLRIEFISTYKYVSRIAKDMFAAAKKSFEPLVNFPPGLFMPSLRRSQNILRI